MSVPDIIRSFPLAQKDHEGIIERIVEYVRSGDIDPLEVELYLKAMDNIVSSVRKDMYYKEAVEAEADKYPEKKIPIQGCIVEKSSRSTMDYSTDQEWCSMNKDLKARETMLKSLEKEMVDPDTGVVATPPAKKVSSFFKITFQK